MKQEDRSAATRSKLIKAARQAFSENGYAETSTPALAQMAGISRGALYHQFSDKKALFRAVVEDLQTEVLEAIEQHAVTAGDAVTALKVGSRAFLEAAATPDYVQIVMIEGPAVLGLREWHAIDRAKGVQSMVEGLEAAQVQGKIATGDLEIMAGLLSGALNDVLFTLVSAKDRKHSLDKICMEMDRLIDGLRIS